MNNGANSTRKQFHGCEKCHEEDTRGSRSEVKLWVIQGMINRRAGEIRGRMKRKKWNTGDIKSERKTGGKRITSVSEGKHISREDTLNGERYTSAFSPNSTQARIASSSRNV